MSANIVPSLTVISWTEIEEKETKYSLSLSKSPLVAAFPVTKPEPGIIKISCRNVSPIYFVLSIK